MSRRTVLRLLAWAGIAVVLVALYNLFDTPRPQRPLFAEMPYSQLLAEVEAKNIQSVTLDDKKIQVQHKDGRRFISYIPPAEKPVERMLANGVTVTARADPAVDDTSVAGAFINWVPFFVYIGIIWLFIGRPLSQIERRLQTLETALAKRPGASQHPEP